MLDSAAWDQVADRVRRRGLLPQRSPADLCGRRRPDRAQSALRCGHAVRVIWTRQGLLDQVGGLCVSRLAGARHADRREHPRLRGHRARALACCASSSRAGNSIVGSALEPEGREAREIVDDAERAVFEIAERGSRGKVGFRTVKSILPDVVNRIDELYHSDGKTDRHLDRVQAARRDDLRSAGGRSDHHRRPTVHGQDHARGQHRGERRARREQIGGDLQHGNVRRIADPAHDFVAGHESTRAICAPAACRRTIGRASTRP